MNKKETEAILNLLNSFVKYLEFEQEADEKIYNIRIGYLLNKVKITNKFRKKIKNLWGKEK